MVKNREAWRPAVHGVTKNQTQLSKLTTTKTQTLYRGMVENIAIHLRENKWSIFVLLYYKGLSTPVLLPGKSQGQEEPGGLQIIGLQKSQTKLSDYKTTTTTLLNCSLKYFNTMLPHLHLSFITILCELLFCHRLYYAL